MPRSLKILKVVQSQTERRVRSRSVIKACEKLGTTIRKQLPNVCWSEKNWRTNTSQAVSYGRRNYKEAQSITFSDEITGFRKNQPLLRKSSLLPFTPILIEGILRSNTRLRHSEELSPDVKFPIILPKKSHITRLIVQYHHESEGHQMGVNYTINHLREKYLVIHVRQQVKRVNSEFHECARRFKVQPALQQMAPLPQICLQMTTKPFANCAVDFAGPYHTIQGRG